MGRAQPVSENRIRLVTIVLAAQIFGALPQGYAQAPSAPSPAPSLVGTFKAYAGDATDARVSKFSGLPVPRYASLKGADVKGLAGPSTDYPVAWSYHRAGLPVVIVRESEEWRKIRDPQGDEVWVNARMLTGERTAVTTADGAIRSRAEARAPSVATFAAGAVVKLVGCDGAWCRVEAGRAKGWTMRAVLWGVADLPAGH